MKTTLRVLLIVVLFSSRLAAAVGDWKSFTSVNAVRVLVRHGSTIYAGTSGGLVRIGGAKAMQMRHREGDLSVLTNTEGLPGNSVTALAVDARGDLWLATSSGKLAFVSAQGLVKAVVDDYQGHAINDLQVVGDSLFVALDFGVSLYDLK